MEFGISTACLYPMQTEQSLSTLIAMKFKLFELFFNTYSELQVPYLKKMKQTLDENGCSVKSVHPFTSGFESTLLFSEYTRRYEDGLEFYKKYFEAANIVGAKIFVLHGQRDYKNSHINEEEYFERYCKLYELGKQYNVTVAQENVNAFRSENPSFITRMRKFTHDDCSFVLDIKQAVRAGVSPYCMCSAMGDKIVHVHCNDNNGSNDCLLPGEGTMNFEELLKLLSSFHYTGDFIIEVYRKNFVDYSQLLTAKKKLEQLIL